jgi:hypothetical protein
MDDGRWTVDAGPWTMDHGQSAGPALEMIREWLQPVGGSPSADSMEDALPKISSDAHADDDDPVVCENPLASCKSRGEEAAQGYSKAGRFDHIHHTSRLYAARSGGPPSAGGLPHRLTWDAVGCAID